MKKLVAALLSAFALFAAAPALAGNFDSFYQEIGVQQDGSLQVYEKISVTLDSGRHGIYRDLPEYYTTEEKKIISIDPTVMSVTRDGNPEPYDDFTEGDRLRVKIGDAGTTVSGPHTYEITYTVDGALLSLPDHDELYWNVVTEAWGDLGLPDKIDVAVRLVPGTPVESIRTRCFSSLGVGAKEDCVKRSAPAEASFASTSGYLTIVVGWPKGLVTVQEPREVSPDEYASYLPPKPTGPVILLFPAAVFVLLFILWWKKGREPERKGALVVQYDPPEKANPAEVGVLFDEKADLQDVTATIVHLAVNGYLKIIEEKGKYTFELRKLWASETLTEYERSILDGIFDADAAVGDQVALSSLEKVFYKDLPAIKKQMASACLARGWFAKNPDAVRGMYMGAGFAYIFLMFWFGFGMITEIFKLSGFFAFVGLGLPGVLIIVFGYFMPARTRAGADAYQYALGFKEYLSKAEKYRIKWEEKENIFEKFLPYAMVFGVVDKWAKAFEGIALQPPSWYSGTWTNGFAPLYLANSLTSATSSMAHSLAVAPSSSGGGGFGGGGGGGGGFGGGGGGSW